MQAGAGSDARGGARIPTPAGGLARLGPLAPLLLALGLVAAPAGATPIVGDFVLDPTTSDGVQHGCSTNLRQWSCVAFRGSQTVFAPGTVLDFEASDDPGSTDPADLRVAISGIPDPVTVDLGLSEEVDVAFPDELTGSWNTTTGELALDDFDIVVTGDASATETFSMRTASGSATDPLVPERTTTGSTSDPDVVPASCDIGVLGGQTVGPGGGPFALVGSACVGGIDSDPNAGADRLWVNLKGTLDTQVVPEPGTLGLVGAGLLALTRGARPRHRNAL